MTESFTTTNRYFDNRYYPRGFSCHSDFTTKGTQLPERHGYVPNELDLGKREPTTEEGKLFVAVCRGEREPVTGAERVWSKCITRIKRPKRFHTLSGGKPQVEGAGDCIESSD